MRAEIILITAVFGPAVLALPTPASTLPSLDILPPVAVPGIPSGKVGLTDGIVTVVEDTASAATGDIVRRLDLGGVENVANEVESTIDVTVSAAIESVINGVEAAVDALPKVTGSIVRRIDLGGVNHVVNEVEAAVDETVNPILDGSKQGLEAAIHSLPSVTDSIVRRADLSTLSETLEEAEDSIESTVIPILEEVTSAAGLHKVVDEGTDLTKVLGKRLDLGAVGEIVTEVEATVDPVLADLTSLGRTPE